MVRESAIDFSAVCGIDYTDMSFLCYHGSVRRNNGVWGSTEIGISDPWKDQDVLLMFYLYTCPYY